MGLSFSKGINREGGVLKRRKKGLKGKREGVKGCIGGKGQTRGRKWAPENQLKEAKRAVAVTMKEAVVSRSAEAFRQGVL